MIATASKGTPQLVIFDCDGVLVDSDVVEARIQAELLTKLGWPVTSHQAHQIFAGRSHAFLLDEVTRRIGRVPPTWWREELDERLITAFETELRAVQNVGDAIDRIRIQRCVASNSRYERVCGKLRVVGLFDRFEGRIFSSAGTMPEKPAPDILLFAAREMRVNPAECVAIDDTLHGVIAALDAGMRAFLYLGATQESGAPHVPKGVKVFSDMRNLPEML